MRHRASIAGILAVHLAGALLLVATGAQAAGAPQRAHLHRPQQTSLGLGDSKCILVGEVLKCVPTIVASG
ncbi:MAG TPA: hypothetical protein VD791_03860 [Burkholderiales bacterium]|jgi:hypothetical protein|nr:hypothetical protein [Burkholderiales bacterium]